MNLKLWYKENCKENIFKKIKNMTIVLLLLLRISFLEHTY